MATDILILVLYSVLLHILHIHTILNVSKYTDFIFNCACVTIPCIHTSVSSVSTKQFTCINERNGFFSLRPLMVGVY